MPMWKSFLRNYLSFTKGQRRGLFVLLAIILCCMVLPLFFPYIENEAPANQAEFKKSVSAFLEAQKNTKEKDTLQEIKYFSFDPNKLKKTGWLRLGIPEKVAATILNYRKAGGRFYKKNDLKKIYGLSNKDYKRLLPYIQIKAQKNTAPIKKPQPAHEESISFAHNQSTVHKKVRVPIDINKADSAEWRRLYGIGPVLSARIVRFRDALGGFYKIDQLSEVYNLPDSTFQHIRDRLYISNLSLKKLNINKASVKELKSHPY